MLSFARAAAYTAAMLGALIAPTFADPSLALGLAAVPIQTSNPGHLSVGIKDAGGEAGPQAELLAYVVPVPVPAEQEPPAERRKSLASLVETHGGGGARDSQMECLAGAIYFESKGEPLAGQLAVAEVIINRAKSGRYPASLCGVVKQPGQFSFVRGGRLPRIDRDSAAWRKAVAIAHIAANDLADSPVPSATAFHATFVAPRWRLKRLAIVGRHVFYR